MKKSGILTVALFTLLSLAFVGCKKNKSSIVAGSGSAGTSKIKASAVKTLSVSTQGGTATYDSMLSFFKPDYTAQTPDDITAVEEETNSAAKNATKHAALRNLICDRDCVAM